MKFNLSTHSSFCSLVLLCAALSVRAETLTDFSSVIVNNDGIIATQDCNSKPMFNLLPAYFQNSTTAEKARPKQLPENTIEAKIGQNFGLMEHHFGSNFKLLSIVNGEATVEETRWSSFGDNPNASGNKSVVRKITSYSLPERLEGFSAVTVDNQKVTFQLDVSLRRLGESKPIISSEHPRIKDVGDERTYLFKPMNADPFQPFTLSVAQSFYLWGTSWKFEARKFTIVSILNDTVTIQESKDYLDSSNESLTPLCLRSIKGY